MQSTPYVKTLTEPSPRKILVITHDMMYRLVTPKACMNSSRQSIGTMIECDEIYRREQHVLQIKKEWGNLKTHSNLYTELQQYCAISIPV